MKNKIKNIDNNYRLKRVFFLKCVITGKKDFINAYDFNEAGDLFFDIGWSYDTFMGGYICKEAKIV